MPMDGRSGGNQPHVQYETPPLHRDAAAVVSAGDCILRGHVRGSGTERAKSPRTRRALKSSKQPRCLPMWGDAASSVRRTCVGGICCMDVPAPGAGSRSVSRTRSAQAAGRTLMAASACLRTWGPFGAQLVVCTGAGRPPSPSPSLSTCRRKR